MKNICKIVLIITLLLFTRHSLLTSNSNKVFSEFGSLELIEPNGGEVYGVGAYINILWTNEILTKPFMLEYSIDNGQNWNLISKNATNGSFKWRIPNIISDNCLMRISNNNFIRDKIDSINYFGFGSLLF